MLLGDAGELLEALFSKDNYSWLGVIEEFFKSRFPYVFCFFAYDCAVCFKKFLLCALKTLRQ